MGERLVSDIMDYRLQGDEQVPAAVPQAMHTGKLSMETYETGFSIFQGTNEEFAAMDSSDTEVYDNSSRPREIYAELNAGALSLMVSAQEGHDPDVHMLIGPKGVAVYSNSNSRDGIVVFEHGESGFQIIGGDVNHQSLGEARELIGLPNPYEADLDTSSTTTGDGVADAVETAAEPELFKVDDKGQVVVPAGRYLVGDLCYAQNRKPDGKPDDWDNYLENEKSLDSDTGIGFLGGYPAARFYTADGDGEFDSSDGDSFPVDSGSIGIMAYPVGEAPEGMFIAEFDMELRCYTSEGTIVLGDISIYTDPLMDDDDDEDDEAEPNNTGMFP